MKEGSASSECVILINLLNGKFLGRVIISHGKFTRIVFIDAQQKIKAEVASDSLFRTILLIGFGIWGGAHGVVWGGGEMGPPFAFAMGEGPHMGHINPHFPLVNHPRARYTTRRYH